MRAALFMGALVAARPNSALRGFHQRLLDAGKPKLVANRRRRPKAPHHPQRYHPRAKAMAPSLTAKTVAPPLWGGQRRGSGRPTRRASNGAFDNLLGPRDPPPLPAPTRGGGCANAIDSTQMQQALAHGPDVDALSAARRTRATLTLNVRLRFVWARAQANAARF